MNIHHLALFSHDIERLAHFYETLFNANRGSLFSDSRSFRSYFLRFGSGASVEIMQMPSVKDRITPDHDDVHYVGLHHFAVSVATKADVHTIAEKAVDLGSALVKPPAETEDGYYEAMVTDPDGNLVEVAVCP